MAGKFTPSELTSGLTMAIDFISALSKKVVECGGSPLLIHQLTLPSNEAILEKIAREIVAMQFPIRRSQIEAAAWEKSCNDYDNPLQNKSDCKYWWGIVDLERTYGIPEIQFSDDTQETPLIPEEIREQVCDKPLPYPLVIDYMGISYIVTFLFGRPKEPMLGDVITDFTSISLAEAKYFDLEQ